MLLEKWISDKGGRSGYYTIQYSSKVLFNHFNPKKGDNATKTQTVREIWRISDKKKSLLKIEGNKRTCIKNTHDGVCFCIWISED